MYFRTDGGNSTLYTQEYVDELKQDKEQLKSVLKDIEEYIIDTCINNEMYDGIPDYQFDKTNPNHILNLIHKGVSDEK